MAEGGKFKISDGILEKTRCKQIAQPFHSFQADLLGTEWQYFIEWYPGRGSSGGSGAYQRTSAVRLTSGPRPGHEDVKVEVWTDSDSSSGTVETCKNVYVV